MVVVYVTSALAAGLATSILRPSNSWGLYDWLASLALHTPMGVFNWKPTAVGVGQLFLPCSRP